jgi:copper chaperone
MLTLKVGGMTCSHCTSAVTRAIHSVDPEAPVAVDLATGRVEVESDKSRAELARVIEEAGFSVEQR